MLRGDCSIRVGGLGFTPEQIDACVQRSGLLSLELELPGSADCSCVRCQSPAAAAQPQLSADEIRSLIDQAQKLGCRRIILIDSDSGACPFLHDIIDDIRGRAMEAERFIDDARMTPQDVSFHYERRVSLSLPLDSRAADHSQKQAMFKRLSAFGFGRAGAPGLAVRISVADDNLAEIPSVWRWARSSGIEPHVQVITPRPATDRTLRWIDPERARILFEDLGRIDREEFDRTWEYSPSLTGRSCKRHLFACHATACGAILPCVGVTIPLGDIRVESLGEILLASDVMENLRAYRQTVKEPCGACCRNTDCYGCRGAAYQLTGDYLAGDQLCWKAASTDIPKLPADAGDLIPHGPSMLLVDRLVQIGERRARGEFTIPLDSRWTDAAGKFDETGFIEMIAQSFAASHGFQLSPGQRASHRGLLLGVKDLIITGEARAGDHLFIDTRKTARFGGVGIIEGVVSHDDGAVIATGEIKVWRPSDEVLKVLIP
ncbi:MAG TPA: hypothetical protein VG326_16935 [Tepidisphaeraceae bacterium]|jgi:MoaA/NifB/PqqE/SkfB family radical SAM enzyme/predicted hotdog family 3-hydroxylacyl-ACP dehydratase|nr:hypothetical protein [Tepidisphaeraceae bacterium]